MLCMLLVQQSRDRRALLSLRDQNMSILLITEAGSLFAIACITHLSHARTPPLAALTSPRLSSVWPMNPRSAAHRLCTSGNASSCFSAPLSAPSAEAVVVLVVVPPLSCATFRPHRSRSRFSRRCLRRNAPGRLLSDLRFMAFTFTTFA